MILNLELLHQHGVSQGEQRVKHRPLEQFLQIHLILRGVDVLLFHRAKAEAGDTGHPGGVGAVGAKFPHVNPGNLTPQRGAGQPADLQQRMIPGQEPAGEKGRPAQIEAGPGIDRLDGYFHSRL